MKTVFAVLMLTIPAFIAVQNPAPPSTDIFLVDMTTEAGQLKIGKPVNVTSREGYDNQPMFLPGGEAFLYTSARNGGPTDIYKYNIATRSDTRVTATPEGEYSATITPDGKFFSVIRVEADMSQRLWKFPLNGGQPSLVLPNIQPVGYHAWIDDKTLALFVLGQPATLQIVDVPTQKGQVIADNVGRSLHKIPKQMRVSFVHKLAADNWMIRAAHPRTKEITSIVRTLPGSEDYAWTPDGAMLMGSGSKLFKWNPANPTWTEIADFTGAGVKDITRLAVSSKGDRVAIVAVGITK